MQTTGILPVRGVGGGWVTGSAVWCPMENRPLVVSTLVCRQVWNHDAVRLKLMH